MATARRETPIRFDPTDSRWIQPINPCDDVIILSKDIKRGEVWTYPDRRTCPCRCFSRTNQLIETYKVPFSYRWRMDSNLYCDEIGNAQLMVGCYLVGSGMLNLRRHRCGRRDILVGCDESRFIIYIPIWDNGRIIDYIAGFEGQRTGTLGFDSAAEKKERCCAPQVSIGSLYGHGVGQMHGCIICATYRGAYKALTPANICKRSNPKWTGKIDGIVCCPCESKSEKPRKPQKRRVTPRSRRGEGR